MRKTGKSASWIFSFLIFGGLVFAWLNRQDLYDWLRLRNYTPAPAIAALATDTKMNDTARRLFYLQYPELNNKADFNSHCRENERTIVLGCYISGGQKIYLLDVTEKRLAGVEQVTAAHELLHAAYDRLDEEEKSNVNRMVTNAFAKLNDQRIRETIAEYKKAGADINNELHSILGTEVNKLPQELESYYGRYFTNRAKTVAYSEKYQSEFAKRKAQVAAYDTQLGSLKERIDALQAELGRKENAIDSQKARLDTLLAADDRSAYNALVPAYNGLISSYNAGVEEIRQLIVAYNQILNQRNAIAIEEQELLKALDSRSITPQNQR